MKNNRFENNYYENNRYENYSDNNAYRRAAVKKKQSRAPLALAIISLVLVSLLLASTVWLICVQINHRDKAQPAAVTATLSQNNVLPKSQMKLWALLFGGCWCIVVGGFFISVCVRFYKHMTRNVVVHGPKAKAYRFLFAKTALKDGLPIYILIPARTDH